MLTNGIRRFNASQPPGSNATQTLSQNSHADGLCVHPIRSHASEELLEKCEFFQRRPQPLRPVDDDAEAPEAVEDTPPVVQGQEQEVDQIVGQDEAVATSLVWNSPRDICLQRVLDNSFPTEICDAP